MLGHLFRKEVRDRCAKITALVQQLDELLAVRKRYDSAVTDPGGSQVNLITQQLSALRLLQAEDRLANNLLIAAFGVLSAVVGGVVGYMI